MGNSITQKLKYKQSIIKVSFKYGVTKAAIKSKGTYRRRKKVNKELQSK